MSLTKFSVKNPVLINLIMILVFIYGLYMIKIIPKEEVPSIDFGMFVITVSYPGVSPNKIEAEIVDKIEKEIYDIDNIDRITSTCREGFANIVIEMDENANLDDSWNNLNNELDKVRDLPKDAGNPQIFRIKMREINEICTLVLSGEFDEDRLRFLTEKLQEELLDLENISKVEIEGTREKEIVIDVDKDKLTNYNLTLNQVATAISSKNVSYPAGNIFYNKKEYILRTIGEYQNISDIKSTIITMNEEGNSILLKDIATVKDTLEEIDTINRLDGITGTKLKIYKKETGNIITVIKDVKIKIKDFENRIPGLTVNLRNDDSINVANSINALSSNALLGIVFVFLTLWIFIGWKNALFTSWGIPFSFLLTFILMNLLEITINSLSLFGLILILGMIVDDAIIVTENIHRYREKGIGIIDATIMGVKEIMWPVIAAVSTTIAAFLPLLLMAGQMGKFLRLFPIVVSVALISSLIECLIILPSHIAEFGNSKNNKKPKKEKTNKLSILVTKKYEKAIIWTLSHRKTALLILLSAMFSTVAIYFLGLINFEFFPKSTPTIIKINLKAPIGTKLNEMNEIVKGVEKYVYQMKTKEDVISVVATVGKLRERFQEYINTNYANVTVELKNADKMKYTHAEIKNDIRKYLNSIHILKEYSIKDAGQGGPPTGNDVDLRITGNDYEILEKINYELITELEKIPGITDIESSLSEGKKEIRIIPINNLMKMYGISTQDIGSIVRFANTGNIISKFRGTDHNEIDIRLKINNKQIENIEELKNLKITTKNGKKIKLKEIVKFKFVDGYSEIKHYNKNRYINITASATKYKKDGKIKTQNSVYINSILNKKDGILETLKNKYPDYNIELGGSTEEQRKTYSSLGFAFLIALMLIYTILATQFKSYVQPLIVMLAIPFAIIGVIFGLFITRIPFSMTTMIAFVALAGIVVNDSLVLVDFVNKQREQGLDRWNSLINAGIIRLRPILMTTITTIAGFFPMIFSTSNATKDWRPMAVCMAFGLTFATFLTLFIIPVIYSYIDSFFGKLKLTRFYKHTSLYDALKNRKNSKLE